MKRWRLQVIVLLLVLVPMSAFGIRILAKLRLAGHHPFRGGFVWTDQPNAPLNTPYNPDSRWSYNYTGNLNIVERVGTGVYNIIFPALANQTGSGANGGNVQVTGYGTPGIDCKIQSWETFIPPDATVTVYCYTTTTGTLTNSAFSILLTF